MSKYLDCQEFCEECDEQRRTVIRPADVTNDGLPARLQREAGDRIYSGLLHGFRVRRTPTCERDRTCSLSDCLTKCAHAHAYSAHNAHAQQCMDRRSVQLLAMPRPKHIHLLALMSDFVSIHFQLPGSSACRTSLAGCRAVPCAHAGQATASW